LLLVSLRKIVSNLVSSLDEVFHGVGIGNVIIQVLLSDCETVKLLNCIVVVSNLWESERLLIDLNSVYFNCGVFKTFSLNFFFYSNSIIEVFLVKSDTE
jgi:hypothetical protein